MHNIKTTDVLRLLFSTLILLLCYLPGYSQLTGYSFRKQITIDNAQVSGTSDLTDFPMLFSVTDAHLATVPNGGSVQNTEGYDILFTAADGGTVLDHEIESYDPATGALQAWIRIPTLDYNDDTNIYMYYGNASISTSPSKTSSWNSNYQTVFHLSEDVTDESSGATHFDATANGNNGTQDGNVEAAGKISLGQDFDDTDDVIDFTTPTISNAMTVSAWVRQTTVDGTRRRYVSLANDIVLRNDGVNGLGQLHFYIEDNGGVKYAQRVNGVISADTWHYVVGTYDGNTQKLFIDGAEIDSDVRGITLQSIPANSTISQSSETMAGQIDEVRISDIARSADWIATEYNNQNDPSSFFSIGGEMTTAQISGYSYRKEIIIDNTKVFGTADHLGFPLLVSETDPDLRTTANGGYVRNTNGYDIAFTDADGSTLLDYELEKYDGTTGEYVAWVRIPTLDHDDDTKIYLYYSNSDVSADPSSDYTWNNNYAAVWHMSKDPTGSAPQIPDATSAGNDGTAINMEVGDLVTGQLGEGLSFDGVNEYLNVGTMGDFGANLDQATFQFWINTSTATIFTAIGTVNVGGGTALMMEMNSATPFGGESNGDTRLYLRDQSGIQMASGASIAGFNDGDWHQITYVRGDGNGAVEIFLDGVSLGVTADASDPSAYINFQFDLTIGARNLRGTVDQFGNCQLDEVRFSDVTRSADWIKTEYYNQNDPSTFYSVGTLEVMVGPGNVASNLVLWLKADDMVSGTSPITSWGDHSGNGKHATQAGASDNAVLEEEVHNFNPSVYFPNGDNGYLDVDLDDIKGSDYNVITVLERDDANAYSYVMGITGSGTNERFHFGYRTNTLAKNAHFSNDADLTVNEFDNPAPSIAVLRGQLDQTVGKTIAELRDGVTLSNTETAASQQAPLSGTGTGRIGRDHTNRGFEGHISEVIAYNATLNATELTRIYSYLAIKYGFTLESTGNYLASDGTTELWNATTNATYHHDVAGIGRDDNSRLDQRKSISSNADGIVLLDKGGSFTSDMDFILWGNDDGAVDFTPVGAEPTYDEILVRKWKVAVNGTPGTVTLQMILQDNGNSLEYVLHVDGDGDFTAGSANYLPSDISGDTVTFENVALSNDDFFSLGKNLNYPGGVEGNLTLWLRADHGVKSNGAEISSGTLDEWENFATNPDFTEITVNNDNPTLVASDMNYQPAIYFDGIDDNLLKSGVDADVLFTSQNNTVFYVVRRLPKIDVDVLGGWESDPVGERMAYFENRSSGVIRTDIQDTFLDGTTVVEDLNTIAVAYSDGSARKLFVNGVEEASASAGTMTVAGKTGDFTLGCRPVLNAYTENYTSEMIIYNTALSDSEIMRVQSYLAMKYGITLEDDGGGTAGDYIASDGTTVWDASEGPAYNNQVVALGRDDVSALYLKQSQVETDSLLAWVDELAVNNEANAGVITNDISYIVIGHNNDEKSANSSSTEFPSGITSRFEREWKITNTNFVDTYSLEFEWDSVGNFDINDIRLLVDSDGDFSDATVFGHSDLTFKVGSIIVEGINTTHVPINATSYVTLGSVALGTPLPIELLTFEAKANEGSQNVELSWATASETNNDFFTVERSSEGTSWESVLSVPGAGNTTERLDYMASDQNPLPGLSYYRLKQTDYDGQYSYSDPRQVIVGDFQEEMTIFPNPATAEIYIQGHPEDLASFRLLDVLGRVVTDQISVSSRSPSAMRIDVSQLPVGVYLIQTTNHEQRFIKN